MMTEECKVLIRRLSNLAGQRQALDTDYSSTRKERKRLEKKREDSLEAQRILQEVARLTQEALQFQVSDLCSLGMRSVYPDPYKVNLEFALRRGKSEGDITFKKEGQEGIDPMEAAGGGTADVAAFTLRVVMWRMQVPRSRAVLFLDEPFRNVPAQLLPNVSALLKALSEKLKLQMIVVTHSPELIEQADRVFTVTQRNGVSRVHTKEVAE